MLQSKYEAKSPLLYQNYYLGDGFHHLLETVTAAENIVGFPGLV